MTRFSSTQAFDLPTGASTFSVPQADAVFTLIESTRRVTSPAVVNATHLDLVAFESLVGQVSSWFEQALQAHDLSYTPPVLSETTYERKTQDFLYQTRIGTIQTQAKWNVPTGRILFQPRGAINATLGEFAKWLMVLKEFIRGIKSGGF